MSFLVANVPPIRVFIKKEYLYDHQKGHGELCEGHWVTVKSIRNRALYFETYIYETVPHRKSQLLLCLNTPVGIPSKPGSTPTK